MYFALSVVRTISAIVRRNLPAQPMGGNAPGKARAVHGFGTGNFLLPTDEYPGKDLAEMLTTLGSVLRPYDASDRAGRDSSRAELPGLAVGAGSPTSKSTS